MAFINDVIRYINTNNWYYANDHLSDIKGCGGTMITLPLNMRQDLANFLLKTMGENGQRFGEKYENKITVASEIIRSRLSVFE